MPQYPDHREDAYPGITKEEALFLQQTWKDNGAGYAELKWRGTLYSIFPADPGTWCGTALHPKDGGVKICVQDGVPFVESAKLLLLRMMKAERAAVRSRAKALKKRALKTRV